MTTPFTSRRGFLSILGASAAALTLAACGGGSSSGGGSDADKDPNTITYWLWDANQQPAYQAVADKFHELNPDLTIKINQMGWEDYWTKLTAAFQAGNAPDVFTDHINKFAQYMELGLLLPLDEQEGYSSELKPEIYQDGLLDLWKGEDGHQYGSPKDWDTISFAYNTKMLEEAGFSKDDINNWDWNPDDGGTFEKIIAHLTVDANGKRGDEDGFDKSNIAVYGLAFGQDAGGSAGQSQWSPFTGATGWNYMDKPTWGTHYNYDDKDKFQKSIDWFFGLVDKGYLPAMGVFSDASGPETQMGSEKAAVTMCGAWVIQTMLNMEGVDIDFAPSPKGPIGHPMSMMNGLGDSINAATKNPEGAAKWVAFLGSEEGQAIVAEHAIVFPATKSGTETVLKKWSESGKNIAAYTQPVEAGHTFYFPLSYHGEEIQALMSPAMEAIYQRSAKADSLTAINEQVNALFQ
ncbi:ABC transporter substrate-binding protein [Actinomyces vulturis]|uniref:ABC transporter substrate-binding protein n=1 Tax=Actinomyces vulturis TaxID=1857645 RepID=UPI00082E35DB|nr:sugar ABC transporter substrate-binding protein [Actinomyces vulturis]